MNEDFPHNLPNDEHKGAPQDFSAFRAVPSISLETDDLDTPAAATTATFVAKYMDTGTKALAVVGLLAILALLGWGGLKVVQTPPGELLAAVSNITSFFVPARSDEDIMFTLSNHNITVDEETTLTWAHETNNTGTYFFQYDCDETVTVADTQTQENIACGTPFELPTSDKTLSLLFSETKKRFIDIPVHLTFFEGNTSNPTAQATTLLTIVNENPETQAFATESTGSSDGNQSGSISQGVPQQETQIIGGSGSANSVAVSDPNGIPDLRVSILSTGIVDKATNAFTPGVSVKQGNRAGISFAVENVGTKATGNWSFIVDLPLSGGRVHVYRPTEVQHSLNPGERIEYTLGFDGINRSASSATAIVNVDTTRVVPETNISNNVAEAVILIE